MNRYRRFSAVVVVFFCWLGICPADSAPAAQATQQTPLENGRNKPASPLHANPWAFSAPDRRDVKQWQRGADAEELRKKAVQGSRNERPVNTSSAIDEALKRAEQESQKSAGLNLSIRQENTSFRETRSPTDGEARPDEKQLRTGRHIVGAFADVRSGEDLHIRVGPELILKDEQSAEKSVGNQPDSAVGMGLQFKLDF
ncbi:MAG: hypothetical protein LBR31_04930 [Desulfovibrio sp.]|nr:hypothetical protein [Desulfovibrio sp.]